MKLLMILILTLCQFLTKSLALEETFMQEDCAATIDRIFHQDENLIVEYTPSTCAEAVSEELYYTIGEEAIQIHPIAPGLAIIFFVPSYCSFIKISINTLDTNGDTIGSSTKEYQSVLPSVTNLHLEVVEEGLKLLWDKQDFAEECGLSYVAKYDDQMQICQSDSECIINRQFCVKTTFTVYAAKDGFDAGKAMLQFEGLGPVTHVQIIEIPNQLVVVWEQPDCDLGDAELKYIVNYIISNKTQTIETEKTFYYFDYEADICSDVEITITAVMDDIQGAPYNTIHNTPLGDVRFLYGSHENNTVNVIWSTPTVGSDCDFDYLVTLVNSEGTNISQTVNNRLFVDFENVYMEPCENATVSVTPIRGSIYGSELKIIVDGEIGPVTNIRVEDNGYFMAVRYDEPENSDLCNLSYDVQFDGPAECLYRNISIAVLNKFGDAVHLTQLSVQQDLGQVDNLALTRKDGTATATWDLLDIPEECGISYEVTYTWNGETHQEMTTNKTYTIHGTSCFALTFAVKPIVGNVVGYDRYAYLLANEC